eukprot:359290-Chlamydomonas_euryale.AAC.7
MHVRAVASAPAIPYLTVAAASSLNSAICLRKDQRIHSGDGAWCAHACVYCGHNHSLATTNT